MSKEAARTAHPTQTHRPTPLLTSKAAALDVWRFKRGGAPTPPPYAMSTARLVRLGLPAPPASATSVARIKAVMAPMNSSFTSSSRSCTHPSICGVLRV